tara:strand:+ start:56 stop:214 length:159 start_codon:yes stop_codon:yes gene_type:complete
MKFFVAPFLSLQWFPWVALAADKPGLVKDFKAITAEQPPPQTWRQDQEGIES